MKPNTITIRLDDDLSELLAKASEVSGINRSELAREALRRQLRITTFDAIREGMISFAARAGYVTDEDVFREVS
jgi:predicted transcriptional regulator